MKKLIIAVILSITLLCQAVPVQAEQRHLSVEDYATPKKIRCTCYTSREGAKTATGKKPYLGIIAGPRDWFGCAVAVYEVAEDGSCGDFIGWWEVDDTGPNDLLISGRAIDMWQPSLDDAYDWIATHGDYVYIKLIIAEG